LATLQLQNTGHYILVVDNASTDGTSRWINTTLNTVLISLATQHSVAQCWNLALDWAFHKKTWPVEEVLVVNNDTELRPDTYATLRRAISESGIGLASCVSVRTHEQRQGDFTLSGIGE